MSEYSKMIEHIKLGEIRISAITKEIKECEIEIKKLEEECDVMKSKEKQLKEELEYKMKTVNEKEWELLNLKRAESTWLSMNEEKKALLVLKKHELESMQQKVWDTRRKFNENALEFIQNNNILSPGGIHIGKLIKVQEEKIQLVHSIEELEKNVNAVEKEYNGLKAEWDLLQHLEKDRESLIEFEHSHDVLRLDNKIGGRQRELEELERELAKYCDRAMMKQEEMLMIQRHQSNSVGPDSFGGSEEHNFHNEATFSFQEMRQPSVPRFAKFQIKVPSSLNESLSSKRHYNIYPRENYEE